MRYPNADGTFTPGKDGKYACDGRNVITKGCKNRVEVAGEFCPRCEKAYGALTDATRLELEDTISPYYGLSNE